MTPYATRADLDKKPWSNELPILADRDRDGEEDVGVVDGALAWATRMIDSKLAGRFDLASLTAIPPRIVDIACDLARYELYGDQVTEHVRLRYEDAISQLNAARDGKETLGIQSDGNPVSPVSSIIISSEKNVFGNNQRDFY
jgi:phage gp36-like protein